VAKVRDNSDLRIVTEAVLDGPHKRGMKKLGKFQKISFSNAKNLNLIFKNIFVIFLCDEISNFYGKFLYSILAFPWRKFAYLNLGVKMLMN
jgi:hypothetical protein